MIKGLVLEGLDEARLLECFVNIEDQIKALRGEFEPKTATEYMTRKEVADLFSVSLPTVHDWSKKGILSAYRIGNRVYFKRHEVEAAATPVQR